MAGISWAEAVSNGTNSPISNGKNFLISNVTNAISGAGLGADLQHSNGTNFLISNGKNFPISNGTNFLISNLTNAISGGGLGSDLQDSNGTNSTISNWTNVLISNVTNAISGAGLGADSQHSSGTNFLISSLTEAISGGGLGSDLQDSNGTNFLISSVTNAISGGSLGSDLQDSNGTNFLISNVTEAISGAGLGSHLQDSNMMNFLISNGTNFLISNVTEAISGAGLGADLQPYSLFAVTYSLVLLLGLAGNGLSLSLLSCRAKPLSHSYILLLQLALLDTLFLCVLPLHIHSQLQGGTWSFGDTACRLTGALSCLHSSLSVAFFSCLALDLWLAVLHPLTSIQLRATHYVLLATALWLLALGGTVPAVLHSREPRSCLGSFPGSWAQPTAPLPALGFVFGLAVPFSSTLLGLPLLAGSVWRGRRGAARRKALGTILIMLGICALCFLPQQLSQLLQLLLATPQQPLPSLLAHMQRVSQALASCSCCLNPLLYHFHSSSRAWHCPCRLRLRSKRVFTICDQQFGDPSWDYRPGQRRGRKIQGDGIH